MQVYLFIAALCLIVIAIFIFQNPVLISVQFLGWNSPEMSLGIIILLAVITGIILTFMLDTIRYFKLARTIRELKNANNKLEKRNVNLKNDKSDTPNQQETSSEGSSF